MSRPIDALAAARAQNAALRTIILAVAALGAAGMYFAHAMPRHLDIHLAPDIKAGDTVSVDSGRAAVPEVNVYGFAYYIWQQVNRWQADGAKDYGDQIFHFQAYLTPSCREQLQADLQQRAGAGELHQRTRHITEIPGRGYAGDRVVADGPSAWTVLLDMQLMESLRGQPVKDAYIRYPIRVVEYDVDRERNPWRLAIDCFGNNRPSRLDGADVKSGKTDLPKPGSLTPATLPGATGETAAPDGAPAPVTGQPGNPAAGAATAASQP
jgi:integrating conjugative element protein (TIGR03746 family)